MIITKSMKCMDYLTLLIEANRLFLKIPEHLKPVFTWSQSNSIVERELSVWKCESGGRWNKWSLLQLLNGSWIWLLLCCVWFFSPLSPIPQIDGATLVGMRCVAGGRDCLLVHHLPLGEVPFKLISFCGIWSVLTMLGWGMQAQPGKAVWCFLSQPVRLRTLRNSLQNNGGNLKPVCHNL